MTNQEAKEKAIREAYAKHKLPEYLLESVSMENGTIVTHDRGARGYPHRQHKALSGMVGTGKRKELTWVMPPSIVGVVNNNGWNRIDGPDALPSTRGQYTVLGKSGKIEEWTFTGGPQNIDFWLEYFTHWRPVVELPRPIY